MAVLVSTEGSTSGSYLRPMFLVLPSVRTPRPHPASRRIESGTLGPGHQSTAPGRASRGKSGETTCVPTIGGALVNEASLPRLQPRSLPSMGRSYRCSGSLPQTGFDSPPARLHLHGALPRTPKGCKSDKGTGRPFVCPPRHLEPTVECWSQTMAGLSEELTSSWSLTPALHGALEPNRQGPLSGQNSPQTRSAGQLATAQTASLEELQGHGSTVTL